MAYCVYIMSSATRTLYVGVTNNLVRRVFEHKNHFVAGFSDKFNTTSLVYYEVSDDPISATEREKQIKSYRRHKKLELIEEFNPSWLDLSNNI